MKLTKENAEMPVYCGLGVLYDQGWKPVVRNLAGTIKLAERMARKRTKRDRFKWDFAIWSGPYYRRISFCAQREVNR